MTIASPHRSRERILVYGNAGNGKSKGALDIGRATGAKLWVVDTDRAWERMLEESGYEGEVELIDVRREAHRADVHPFVTTGAALDRYSREMGEDDWLVVDMATVVWPWAQAYFSEQVFGKQVDDFFVEARKRQVDNGKKGGSAFDGMADWPTINRLYDSRFNEPLLLAAGNVYIIAEAQELREGQDAQETMNAYGGLGARPKGQKGLDYLGQTVLWMGQSLKGDWVFSTAKDRERQKVTRKVWGDFGDAYLRDIGGWKNAAVIRAAAGKATTGESK